MVQARAEHVLYPGLHTRGACTPSVTMDARLTMDGMNAPRVGTRGAIQVLLRAVLYVFEQAFVKRFSVHCSEIFKEHPMYDILDKVLLASGTEHLTLNVAITISASNDSAAAEAVESDGFSHPLHLQVAI